MATGPEKTIVPPDPELGSSVLGQTTSSDEPATDSGVDSSAGDAADATTSGGPGLPVGDVDPAIRNAAMNAMQAVRDYAATKRA